VTNLNDGRVVDVVVTGERNDWQKKFVEWSHTKMNKRNRHIMMMMMMMIIMSFERELIILYFLADGIKIAT
jgi:acylphosphatase